MAEFDHSQRRAAIQSALADFQNRSLEDAAIRFLAELGYQSDHTADFGHTAAEFLANIPNADGFNRQKAQIACWRRCAFLFQITGEDIPGLAERQRTFLLSPRPLGEGPGVRVDDIQSFVFLAIELRGEDWARPGLAGITRELNRFFPMPAIVLFKYGSPRSPSPLAPLPEGEGNVMISLAVIDRRAHLRDPSRDVIDSRITVIKDVRCADPHRAHLDILVDLAIENLGERCRPGTFRELYDAWIAVLSIQALNQRFYTELAWWYFWAIKQVQFPKGGGADANKRHAVAVIRLLTRLIFVWFIKEKGLIPPDLFDRARLRELLKTDPAANPEAGNYYLAILQNLFFATLNVEMGTDEQGNRRRRWASENKSGGQSGHYLIPSVYRHQELFEDPDAALALFSTIPFLNGGLFECLDRELAEPDFQRNPELKSVAVKEGSGWVLRVDGFSRRKEAQAVVPNKLFFGSATADLNTDLGTKGKHYEVRGLIDLFDRYKFTVDENTPVEEEVALDPELLGKVFENLLASYNEDTQTTARKQSGSFYTPREVVDYMVDEALIAYLENRLNADWIAPVLRSTPLFKGAASGINAYLRHLLAYHHEPHQFNEAEVKALVQAIDDLKILDPACGSGAFPMGILHKLVFILGKLDPDNRYWRDIQRQRAIRETEQAYQIGNRNERRLRLEEIDDNFERNTSDYGRKLYLIEDCIYGADIQPVAVQIAKLRFFISLVVEQQKNPALENLGIRPLPNLETKFVAANTLLGLDGQILMRSPEVSAREKELKQVRERHFNARTLTTKAKYREQDAKLRDEIVTLLKREGYETDVADRLANWNPYDQNKAADFFDPEWMFGLQKGFDIVIGNPPYVRQEKIKDLKPLLKKSYQCFTGVADLYVYFYERSIRLLKPEGIFAFITSNKWYRANYGEKLREWMNRNTRILSIIDFGDADVFTAIAYPTILIAKRRKAEINKPATGDTVKVLNWTQEHPIEIFPAVFATENFPVPQMELKKEGWQLETPVKRRMLERIRATGKPLGEYVQGRFYRGILTGLNEAFLIDGATRTRLIAEDPKSADIIKPFLRGRDVKRWRVEFADQYLIKIESSENKKHPWSDYKPAEAETVFANTYPAIYTHFQSYRQALVDRYDQGRFLWELRACVYWQNFEKPKIVYPDIALSPQFAWDSDNRYLANTAYIIPTDKKWLLAALNSSICSWFYAQISPQIQNGYFRFIAQYCEKIPIPSASDAQKILIQAIVTAILAPTTLTPDPSPACGRGEWERLINGLVYELFFPDDLHQINIRLFDTAAKAGLDRLAALDGSALADAASEIATAIFASSHPIQGMLADLQKLEVVRVIEGQD